MPEEGYVNKESLYQYLLALNSVQLEVQPELEVGACQGMVNVLFFPHEIAAWAKWPEGL